MASDRPGCIPLIKMEWKSPYSKIIFSIMELFSVIFVRVSKMLHNFRKCLFYGNTIRTWVILASSMFLRCCFNNLFLWPMLGTLEWPKRMLAASATWWASRIVCTSLWMWCWWWFYPAYSLILWDFVCWFIFAFDFKILLDFIVLDPERERTAQELGFYFIESQT